VAGYLTPGKRWTHDQERWLARLDFRGWRFKKVGDHRHLTARPSTLTAFYWKERLDGDLFRHGPVVWSARPRVWLTGLYQVMDVACGWAFGVPRSALTFSLF